MIEIFEQERLDGLAELMSCDSIAYTTEAVPSKEISQESYEVASKASPDNTLFPLDSVLATVGWNLNDAIFLPEEILKAKDTPVDKPFNKMHDEEDIIGHMTASRLLDAQYKEVPGPDFDHIGVSSVIYRTWRDKDKEEEIDNLIAEIEEGKWKVSMECLYPRFDYGIITQDGKQLIIERTAETSYLTKYLRKYKGPGVVNGNRIGQVLRDFTFSGKGLVTNPGNPYSVIFNKNTKFFGETASINEIKEFVMNEHEKAELDKAKVEAETAKAELAKFKEEAAQATATKLNEAVAQRDTVIAEQTATITALQADIAKVNATVSTLNSESESAKAEAVSLKEKLATAEASLKTIEAEKITIARKAALANAGVSIEKATSLIEKFATAGDELFNTLVAAMTENKETCSDKKGTKEEEKKEEAKLETTAEFEKAEINKEAELNVETAEKAKTDSEAIASYLVNNVLTVNKKGK